jgi:HD superfamily phosphohydrolase
MLTSVPARGAKLFRDPVHDIISLDLGIAHERMLFALACTPQVQRLRRIRQLGLANLIYPGAEHSRFAHSLGVAHMARRMLLAVSGPRLDEGIAAVTLAAALLHDIGHGPFSHAIEKVTGIDHEDISAAALRDPEGEVSAILAAVDPALPEAVAALIAHGAPRTFYGDIVSSQIDADRLDYILRDGLATGVRINTYDLERILSTLEAAPGHLVISLRAREAVEGYLLARFHMFKQVYLHKAVRAAEKMLEAAMARAAELLREGQALPGAPPGPLQRLLRGERLAPLEFLRMDDTDVWMALKVWAEGEDVVLRELARGLLERRLYKTLQVPERDAPGAGGPIDAAVAAVAAQGGDPRYHLLLDRAGDTPYRPYVPGSGGGQRPIMVSTPQGGLERLEVHSDLIHLLGRDRYEVQRLCFPAWLRDAVTRAVQAAMPAQQMLW